MSDPEGVVWADNRVWVSTHGPAEERWITEYHDGEVTRAAIGALRQHDDFMFLVRDGEPQDYALALVAARRDLAKVTAERDAQAEELRSYRERVTLLAAERDEWKEQAVGPDGRWCCASPDSPCKTVAQLRDDLEAATTGREEAERDMEAFRRRLAATMIQPCACACTLCLEASDAGHQWRVETAPIMTEESDGHVRIEWRDDRRFTLVARSMLTHLVYAHNKGIRERAAIVAWHRRNLYRPDHWTGEDYADAIESGEHLAGDDE